MPDSRVILIGFMGSGKTTLGRLVARTLGVPFVDLDNKVVQRAGRSVARIFREAGEAEFRDLETQALREALLEPGVIAPGGGILLQARNRQLLQRARERGHVVCYLKAPAAVLAERIRRQPGRRPLIDGDGRLNLEQTQTRVRELLKEREPAYLAAATCVLDCGELKLEEAAHELLRHIAGGG